MINLVCALQCEAKSLIKYYGLRGITDTIFRLYEKNEIRLVVTGIGKINTAAAVAYLHARFEERKNQVWLNIGVAGHAYAEPRDFFLVNKSEDAASGLRYYPAVLTNKWKTAPLITVDQPEKMFACDALYDMEASAFFAVANRFSSAELVASIKMVSDNKASGVQHVNEAYVEALITQKLDDINGIVQHYQALQQQCINVQQLPALHQHFLEKFRFSAYEQKQLEKLMRKWVLHFPEPELAFVASAPHASAKTILSFMQTRLAKTDFDY